MAINTGTYFRLPGLLLILAATPASAYCIHNDSTQRLFFEVGDHNIVYRTWIAPGAMACCDWRKENCNWTASAQGHLKVRVLDQRIDGKMPACSSRVRGDGNLYLRGYAPKNACTWAP